MKAAHRVPSVSPRNAEPESARVVLLVTADAALTHQLIRALSGNGDAPRPGEARPVQFPIATSVAQARACLGRIVPAVILLDEGVAAPAHLEEVLCDLSQVAPLVLLAAPESFARLCAMASLADLLTQGRVDCVSRHGDFAPLAACLLARHARSCPESRGFGTGHRAAPAVAAVPEHVCLSAEDAPRDFGEVLRHEVNNPLTGILGNAELLLSRRDRVPADMVERLEVIADLAIRLRETIRRLSNALDRPSTRLPVQPAGGLAHAHRHRPLT